MKLSKILHVVSVVAGLSGVVSFAGSVLGGADNLVFGITKADALACAAVLMLIAIWTAISTIHHLLLERNGELI